MNPTSDVVSRDFSSCSLSTVCNKLTVLGKCLQDPGSRTTIQGSQCGNGVKEPGEDCDCGPADDEACRNNVCCDGKTCKYKEGAQCSDNNDLCCTNCKVKSKDSVCRPSRGICDVEEKCDGFSGICPSDVFVEDLTQCDVDPGVKGQCASGDCTNRDLQCKLKGSSIGVSGECPGYSDQCALYCQGPDNAACIQVSGFFVDGSPCSYGGKCANGQCQVDPFGRLIGWAQAHMATAIAILCVVIFLLAVCCGRCISVFLHNRKVRQQQAARASQRSLLQPIPANQVQSNYPASIFLDHSASAPPKGWVDPTIYNGTVDEVDLSTVGVAVQPHTMSEPRIDDRRGRQSRPLSINIPQVPVERNATSLSPTRTQAIPRSKRQSTK